MTVLELFPTATWTEIISTDIYELGLFISICLDHSYTIDLFSPVVFGMSEMTREIWSTLIECCFT